MGPGAALGASGLLGQSPYAQQRHRGRDGDADASQEHERHEREGAEGTQWHLIVGWMHGPVQ
jgi:hypothetical protein